MRVKESKVQMLRAAAYIRVSTISENQEDSFENQKEHFEKLLVKNKQYENAGIYSDYTTKFGICFKSTGNMRKMDDFIDYRKTTPDGKTLIIEDRYQVYDYRLQYIKRKSG